MLHGLFSSYGEQGLLFVSGYGLLVAVASLAAEQDCRARGLQIVVECMSVTGSEPTGKQFKEGK